MWVAYDISLLSFHSRKTLQQSKGTSVKYLKLNRVYLDYILEQERNKYISLSQLQGMGNTPELVPHIKSLYMLRQPAFPSMEVFMLPFAWIFYLIFVSVEVQ